MNPELKDKCLMPNWIWFVLWKWQSWCFC